MRFEVPAHWALLVCTDYTDPSRFQAGWLWGGGVPDYYAEAVYDPAMGPGEILEGEEDGVTLWIGYAIVGDWAVVVRTHRASATVADILATVRG